MSRATQVFVYGTLRPPRPDTSPDDSRYYPRIAPYLKDVKPALMSRAVLYDLGTYPGAYPGEGEITGEVLTLAPAALTILDRIEGHPRFFQRKKVTVKTADGSRKAWIYWAPEPLVLGRDPIPSGDWFQRDSETEKRAEEETKPSQQIIDPTLHELSGRFARAEYAWLSSVRPDGRPRNGPSRHIWYRGRVYILLDSQGDQVKDILENPAVSITHPDPENPIIVEGWATPVMAMISKIELEWKSKYGADIDDKFQDSALVEITPLVLRAQGKYGEGEWRGREIRTVG